MTGEENSGSDIDKLVPESETITLNGEEIEVRPIKNEDFLKAAMTAEQRGDDNIELFMQLATTVLEDNGYDVTARELRDSRGNILPLITAIQEVNSMADFSDEDLVEEMT
jgi:hypothetical protein